MFSPCIECSMLFVMMREKVQEYFCFTVVQHMQSSCIYGFRATMGIIALSWLMDLLKLLVFDQGHDCYMRIFCFIHKHSSVHIAFWNLAGRIFAIFLCIQSSYSLANFAMSVTFYNIWLWVTQTHQKFLRKSECSMTHLDCPGNIASIFVLLR